MNAIRRAVGLLVLAVVAVELALVLTGVVDLASAARVVIAVELSLAGFVVLEVVLVTRAVRRARRSGADLPFALDEALGEFFPQRVARYVRQDMMLVRALWMLLTGRRDVAPGEQALPYSGPLVTMLAVLCVVDAISAVLLHLLLPEAVRTVALVLGAVGLVWLLGFVASLVCYPHVVSAERVRLRFSAFHDLVVPASAVLGASTTTRQPRTQKSAERFDDELEMVVSGQAGVVVQLEPVDFRSLNPKVAGGRLSRVVFHADRPDAARRALQGLAADRRP